MNSRIITSLLLLLAIAFTASADLDEQYLSSYGISYTYVNTKKGQSILVYTSSDITDAQKNQLRADLDSLYQNVEYIDEATSTYNCHNYAWYMVEGHSSSKYWMDPVKPYTKNANISKFWTNDAFVETTGAVYDKIVYYSSSSTIDTNITHSAVVSSTPGYYISKWGSWPLVRHLPDDVPPIYGTVKRYFKPIPPTPINGVISCSNGTGTIGVNVSASYTTSVPSSILAKTTNIIYYIENGKGDDAIEEGYAVINSQSDVGMNVKFTKQGIYEMYIRYYNKYNELLAEYWFEPLVSSI